jgi:hypothetical protein
VDDGVGDLTDESRGLVVEFVRKVFIERLNEKYGGGNGEQRVLWFKNWVALQSIRTLEHLHVLVRDVPEDIIEEWTRVLPEHRLEGEKGCR